MFEGELLGICITETKASPLRRLEEARAVAGRGLEGDRYFLKAGTYSKKDTPDREVTLIESEALEALAEDYGLALTPEETRRNLLTRGVPLNHLVGREFLVGGVRLRGIKLCEPCGHLETLTVKGARAGLVHRGGLRARVVQGGILRAGDPIRPAPPIP